MKGSQQALLSAVEFSASVFVVCDSVPVAACSMLSVARETPALDGDVCNTTRVRCSSIRIPVP